MSSDSIRFDAMPTCFMCGSPGHGVHSGLRDVVMKAPGTWSLSRCTNATCRMVWMDPLPLKEDIHRAYARYYTHADPTEHTGHVARKTARDWYGLIQDGYLSRRYGYVASAKARALGLLAFLLPLHRTNMDFAVMCLPRKTGGRFLDIGCGGGRLLETMRDRGWSVRGLDFDDAAVANARRKGLVVDIGDIRDQRWPDESFEAIAMNHVVEHVYDLPSLLRECLRLLAPGGTLVMTTPNPDGLGHRWFGRHWRGLEIPRHLQICPAPTLAALATDNGFDGVRWATTIRGAQWYLADSIRIRARALGRKPFLRPEWAARLLQVVEYVALKFNGLAGEECAVVATKPAVPSRPA